MVGQDLQIKTEAQIRRPEIDRLVQKVQGTGDQLSAGRTQTGPPPGQVRRIDRRRRFGQGRHFGGQLVGGLLIEHSITAQQLLQILPGTGHRLPMRLVNQIGDDAPVRFDATAADLGDLFTQRLTTGAQSGALSLKGVGAQAWTAGRPSPHHNGRQPG